MSKPQFITLAREFDIPILYEDRSVLAVDKPAGWLLAPSDWDRTGRNLQLAITSSIRAGDFWARSRSIKFLRFIHRLDAETTGVLLFAKSAGAVPAYSRLFEARGIVKQYYAVAQGEAHKSEWTCRLPIGPDTRSTGRMRIVREGGKPAETRFAIEAQNGDNLLISATPVTGRTHQIRVHLLEAGLHILGDPLYGRGQKSPAPQYPLALRAASLEYTDVFTRRKVRISADMDEFRAAFGFGSPASEKLLPPGL